MAGRRCTMRKLSRSIEAQAHYKYQHSIVLERARMTRLHARTRTHTHSGCPMRAEQHNRPSFPCFPCANSMLSSCRECGRAAFSSGVENFHYLRNHANYSLTLARLSQCTRRAFQQLLGANNLRPTQTSTSPRAPPTLSLSRRSDHRLVVKDHHDH